MHPLRPVLCLSMGLLLSGPASGSGDIHASGSFVSDAPGGTPPLMVNSSDLVSNLNADMLDGSHGTDFALKTELPDDGVLEINQDCAVNTGCFTGDSAGFPVSITNTTLNIARSFRLTSNLDVSGVATPEEVTAISVINSPGVIINLNGFSIQGPTTCTGLEGSELACSHMSSSITAGAGIFGGQALTVRNGAIRGMGGSGFFCNANCAVIDMHFSFNGRQGAHLAGNSLVSGSTFYRNAGDGLQTGFSSRVIANSADSNAGDGFELGDAGVIRNSTSMQNGGSGIVAFSGSLVVSNTARGNTSHGIDLTNSMALSNTLLSNIGAGLNLDSDSVARTNALWNDSLVGGNQMGDNWCETVLCP